MKKFGIILFFSVLFVVILCVTLFIACRSVEQIEASQVEKIEVWAWNTEAYALNADDSARFIELYNASKDEGKEDGSTTPDFGVRVYFRDGTCLKLTDFHGFAGKHFMVSYSDSDGTKSTWYISSQELYTFVSELANRSEESGK